MNLKGGKSQVLSIVPKSNYKYFDLLRFCGYAQKLNNPGCKFTTGKMFAYTVIGSISLWSRNSYCADGFCTISDYLIRFSSGASHIGENLRRTMLLTGKLMVMLFLFLTVWLNWGQSEPMYFAAKVTLIFLFTKPVPSSIYIFVDQERLNQVLMEKKKESRSGMEIMNLLQKEGRQRGTWSAKKADNDFYKKIVDAYEAKNQELAAENADLRALLRSMQVDMREFLNAPNGKQSCPVNERPESDPSQSPLGGRTDMFDLPLHMARDQIEESLRTKMASIKERMVQLQDAQKGAEVTSEVTERELELEAQLVEARTIIQEQATIMSKHLAKSEKPRRLSGHLSSDRDSMLSSPSEGL